MSAVCHPESGKVTVLTFAAVAKYYGVQVAICPPRRGNRKGVVEKSTTAAQRWWRTYARRHHRRGSPASLDRFCELRVMLGCVPPPLTRRPRAHHR